MSRMRLAAFALLVAGACSSQDAMPPVDLAPDPDPLSSCEKTSISRFRELTVVEDSVVNDPRSRNDADGPWSFRFLIEQMTPPGVEPETFVRRWLDSWLNEAKVNLFPVSKRIGVEPYAICPWLRRTPENACDVDCRSCAGDRLDLSKAPFRLVAIVNRIDLREQDASEPAGEARFIYGLVNGLGDDPAAVAQNMSVIFEYRPPVDGGRDAKYWAGRWHELGASEAYDDAYKEKLQAITDAFARRGAAPGAPSDSALAQIRTNELIFQEWPWQLRQFELGAGGLQLAATRNTPDESLNFSESLRSFVLANRDAVLAGTHVLPPLLTSGMAQAGVKWQMAGVSEDLRKAFAQQTCNGCHKEEASSLDVHFHVSPLRKGLDKLSTFLNNPDDPANDELGRREISMRRALCGK